MTQVSGKVAGGFSLARLRHDFEDLDLDDPGLWPGIPRGVLLVLILLMTVALVWWFDWRVQTDTVALRQAEELQLRAEWVSKKRRAVNLHEYRLQLDETDRQFGALLRQLPNRADMDSLLSDINQAGIGRGLQFDLFKPGADLVRDFYAEIPIEIRIVGSYHDLGAFASDVARMSRVVTLGGLALKRRDDGLLQLEARATTYRYLDEAELARLAERDEAARERR